MHQFDARGRLDLVHPVSLLVVNLEICLTVFSEGGVEVGDVDAKALKLLIPVGAEVGGSIALSGRR